MVLPTVSRVRHLVLVPVPDYIHVRTTVCDSTRSHHLA